MRLVKIYDTTLRDGTQAEYFSLSLADKIRIAEKLSQLGIHYIEGGWPGANPKDRDFFNEIHNYNLGISRIAAFGSTHHKDRPPESDPIFQELLISKAPVVTIFGKSWDLHVKEVLRTSLGRNLELINHSLRYLKPHVQELFYDAEHFFDGFLSDPEYALKTLEAALEGGADCLVLCETNGGTTTSKVMEIVKAVRERFPHASLGIHAHNDAEMGVANSVAAVELGAEQVQGTINGFGERCGNANLCSIIPSLKLKLGLDCISDENLRRLTEMARFVYEIANINPNRYQPYVGRSAFAHKGGVHAAAVKLNPLAYEHIRPELVGNFRNIPVSDLSGKSNIFLLAQALGLKPGEHDAAVQQAAEKIKELLQDRHHLKDTDVLQMILNKVKELESQGYTFEEADGSLKLLMFATLGKATEFFRLLSYRVVDQKVGDSEATVPEATLRVRVGLNEVHTASLGNGPVDALYNAVLKALIRFYPRLVEMRLADYKVRVLPGTTGSTAAKVRVHIESRDAHDRWGTVGVSHDIIDASWQALVDSINYKLYKDEHTTPEVGGKKS
jgi:2-isopropylmalate synthase